MNVRCNQFTEYKQIKIKDFTSKYSKYLWNQIKQHANYSSYKVNSSNADCYTFTVDDIDPAKRGYMFIYDPKNPPKRAWSGGWDWTSGIIDGLEYLYNFNNGKLYQL